jgi:hypothetical protein
MLARTSSASLLPALLALLLACLPLLLALLSLLLALLLAFPGSAPVAIASGSVTFSLAAPSPAPALAGLVEAASVSPAHASLLVS